MRVVGNVALGLLCEKLFKLKPCFDVENVLMEKNVLIE